MKVLQKNTVLAIPLFFWGVFYFIYPYRELLDDSTYRAILEGRLSYSSIDRYARILHNTLLSWEGRLLGPSMKLAMFLSLLLHLFIGWIAWNHLIPRLPEKYRVAGGLGVLAFLVHPVSVQTVVHVAQRSEILGLLFVVASLTAYFNRSKTFVLVLCALGAVASKENYVLIPTLLVLVRTFSGGFQKKQVPALISLGVVLLAGIWANAFSGKIIHNEENYRKTIAYFQAVSENREIPAQDSVIFPVRTRSQNLTLQIALLPRVLEAVFAPFQVVKDYGQFPFGRDSNRFPSLPFWIGFGLLLAMGVSGAFFLRHLTWEECALMLSPGILYSVFWVFPVYDPLLLYRLYGVVFLGLAISLPILIQSFTWKKQVALLIFLACGVAGGKKAYEMQNVVRETQAELNRVPLSHRLNFYYLHALIESKSGPVDCDRILRPVLTLAPSAGLVHTEWAWCLSSQGGYSEEIKFHALKALEHEMIPENIHLILGYLMAPHGGEAEFKNVHPSNIPHLVGK